MERMYNIKRKEVINIRDGTRLGFVSDVILDENCGQVKYFIVPAPTKLSCIFSAREYRISWCDVKVLGEDFLLIDADTKTLLSDRKK